MLTPRFLPFYDYPEWLLQAQIVHDLWLRTSGSELYYLVPAPVPNAAAPVGIALLVAFVQYSLQVGEAAQGRYLYLLLLPAALLFTGGLYALPPHRILKTMALSLPLLWLGVMNFVALRLVQ